MSQPTRPTPDNPGRASIFRNLSASARRQIDQAIADRDPPTYREIYNLFDVAAWQISFSAFYRYARKVRAEVDLMHSAALAFPGDQNIHAILPDLIAARLLELINDPDHPPNPEILHRLTRAHRAAAQTLLALETRRATKTPAPSAHTNPNQPRPATTDRPAAAPPAPPLAETERSLLDDIVDEVLHPRGDA